MNNPKIRFVEPAGAPSNVFSNQMNIPLLGPVYLSTISNNAHFDTLILNENILKRKISPEELLDADILCLSCITATIQRGKEIANQYHSIRKKHNLPSKVIVGGIHASMLPSDLGPEFDHIVCGEAESVFLKIINGNINDRIITGIRNDDLDSLPMSNFSLIKNYSSINIWPVMTSRGCPHHCRFCSVTKMFGHDYRTKSIERVIDEINAIHSGWIFIVDDNFTAHPHRTHQILDKLIFYKFQRPWTAQVRVDAAKDILLVRKMRKAGCRIVFIGLESINHSSLEQMKKNQDLTDIKKAISTFQNEDIHVHGMFMLGNDPDTRSIFSSTSKFCKIHKLSYAQYSILTPLPGTEIYEEFEKDNRLIHKKWNLYDGLHVVFKPKQMSALDLQLGTIQCFKSFYSFENAIKGSFTAFFNVLKNIFCLSPRFLQPLYPIFTKIIGKFIILNWIRKNKHYLKTLECLDKSDASLPEYKNQS